MCSYEGVVHSKGKVVLCLTNYHDMKTCIPG